jgi:hypothetical protein
METANQMNQALRNQNVLIVTTAFEFHGGIEHEKTYLFNGYQTSLEDVYHYHTQYEDWFSEHENGTDISFVEWLAEKGVSCEVMEQPKIVYEIREGHSFVEMLSAS